ncbi:MAG: hypothetical protein IJH87_05375 [Atopobiaceae bacterium]|nr:hypothetical protein [Atopobiaceae bacterium]
MADVVYFVKESSSNPELVHSLRSVERNFPHDRVWFCGGCPDGVEPDRIMRMKQFGATKWKRVKNMLELVCKNPEVSSDFWLFNDDFFVLEPLEGMEPWFNGTIPEHILRIEGRHSDMPTEYTAQLRKAWNALEEAGLPTLNYALHVPMLVNRKGMLETLRRFPGIPMFRDLYGNACGIGGIQHEDVKITGMDRLPEWELCSTSDASFEHGLVGRFLRDMFPKPSRWEI